MITDVTGAIIWTWQGDPFGNSAPTSTLLKLDGLEIKDNTLGFTAQGYIYNQRFAGQSFDKETALFYNYFRTYDPATARYIEADPIGLAGGWNRYAYVDGNPIYFRDPKGEFAVAVAVDVALVVAIVGTIVYNVKPHSSQSALPANINNPSVNDIFDRAENLSYAESEDTACDPMQMAKTSKRSGKAKASDYPSYANNFPPKGPNENCGDFAARILASQFASNDPRLTQRGPGSPYSEIKKGCERGGR